MKQHLQAFVKLSQIGLRKRLMVYLGIVEVLSFAIAIIYPVQLRAGLGVIMNGFEWARFWSVGAVLAVVLILQKVTSFFSSMIGNKMQSEMIKNLRIRLFDSFAEMPYEQFTHYKPEKMSTVTNQFVMETSNYMVDQRIMLREILRLLAAGVAAAIMSWQLLLVILVVSPLYVLLSRQVGKKQQQRGTYSMEYYMQLNAETVIQTRSIAGIRLNHAEDWHLEHFEEKMGGFRDQMRAQGIQGARSTTLTDLLILAYFGLFGILGLSLVIRGSLPVEVFLAYLPVVSEITKPLGGISRIWITLNGLYPKAQNVLEMCELQHTEDSKCTALAGGSNEHALVVDGISFAYPEQEKQVLQDISFAVREGEFVAVIGPSGAGKSTLFYLLAGLFTPDAGTIRFKDGVTVGVVPQVPYLFNGTVAENVLLGRGEVAAAEEALVKAQLRERIVDINIPVVEQGKNFSLGEKQRIGIARTQVALHKLLLMDEPGANLDNETHARMMEVVHNLRGEQTILMIAHRLETVQNADRVLVLADGKVESFGTWEELRTSSKVFQRVLEAMGGEVA